jgi:hypothetical protein
VRALGGLVCVGQIDAARAVAAPGLRKLLIARAARWNRVSLVLDAVDVEADAVRAGRRRGLEAPSELSSRWLLSFVQVGDDRLIERALGACPLHRKEKPRPTFVLVVRELRRTRLAVRSDRGVCPACSLIGLSRLMRVSRLRAVG